MIFSEYHSKTRDKNREEADDEFYAITKTSLLYVHHLALLGRFREAKDRLLMTHLHEKLHDPKYPLSNDHSIKMIYNRVLTVLGVSAFRNGEFYDAVSLLSDVVGSGKARELTSQDFKLPKHAPYNQFLKLELIEVVFHLSALLIEIPFTVGSKNVTVAQSLMTPSMPSLFDCTDRTRRPFTKVFRRLMGIEQRALFATPPESSRDWTVYLAKAVEEGEVGRAVEILQNLDIWNNIANSEECLELYETELRVACLLCFVHKSIAQIECIPLSLLSDMFLISLDRLVTLFSQFIVKGWIIGRLIKNDGQWVLKCGQQPASDPFVLEVFNLAEKSSFLKELLLSEPST
ncbi:hypothetical protein GEMRC1_004366 [Eukaryota sp. GEM-RC1]